MFSRLTQLRHTLFRSHQRLRLSLRPTHSDQTGTSSSTNYAARREPWITPTILVIAFIPFLSFGLGTWQLRRLRWKVSLIDDLEERLQLEPLLLPKRINLAVIPEFVYRKVALIGRWDHAHSMLLGPRVREGITGYHVVTPLVRSDGSTVLVNRGFVSKDVSSNAMSQMDDGEVEVLGLLRTSHSRNKFTPDNNPAEGTWYWADVDAMSEYAGGQKAGVQPVFVEEIFDGHAGEVASKISRGIPVGRAPTVDLRNAHLSYVITWYSLSVVTGVMLARLLLKRRATMGRQLPR